MNNLISWVTIYIRIEKFLDFKYTYKLYLRKFRRKFIAIDFFHILTCANLQWVY